MYLLHSSRTTTDACHAQATFPLPNSLDSMVSFQYIGDHYLLSQRCVPPPSLDLQAHSPASQQYESLSEPTSSDLLFGISVYSSCWDVLFRSSTSTSSSTSVTYHFCLCRCSQMPGLRRTPMPATPPNTLPVIHACSVEAFGFGVGDGEVGCGVRDGRGMVHLSHRPS